MKLLNKSTIYYLVFLLPILLACGIIFYFIISQQINANADEALVAQKKLTIESFIVTDSSNLHFFNDDDDDVKIRTVQKPLALQNYFLDTLAYDSTEMEMIPFRELKSYFQKDKKYFEIIITRSNFKSDELAESIALMLAIMFALILISFIFINRYVSRKLFKPFYKSLNLLHTISFADIKPNPFNPSTTKEFQELNIALNRMTEKMFLDFNNQKQFTENASHELQTPLAVIKARIDLLIQNKDVTAEIMEQVQEIEKSVNKLSLLNKSLLLLSNIENKQFDSSNPTQLAELIDKTILEFDEHLKNKSISLYKEYNFPPTLVLNSLLAEILFSNLIQNAIRHNIENGIIKVEINNDYLVISNSGASLKGNEHTIFNRFAKFNPSVESLGLGLAIVKQICDYYNFTIQYSYTGNLHTFRIVF